MRLNRYLTEAKYDDEYIATKVIYPMLVKNSKPFMIEFLRNQRKSGFKWFWRGTNRQITEIGEVKRRKNRKPVDMPKKLHDLLDFKFFEKFKWPVRSEGIFTVPDQGSTISYGSYTYAFFPIGKYRYVWSDRVMDLFAEMYKRKLTPDKADHLYSDIVGNDEVILPTSKEAHFIEMKKYKKWFLDPNGWFAEVNMRSDEIINTFIDDKMGMALAHKFEVVFDCKKYYLVEPQYLIHLERKLRGK
jgi:hypothetical protein